MSKGQYAFDHELLTIGTIEFATHFNQYSKYSQLRNTITCIRPEGNAYPVVFVVSSGQEPLVLVS
jgi:hypothetical protein